MKAIVFILMLAIDIGIGMAAVYVLMKWSEIITVLAIIGIFIGVPIWIAIVAALFTIGKWVVIKIRSDK